MQISTVRRVLQIFFLSVSSIGLSWAQPGVAQSNVVQPDLSQVLVSAASLRKHVFLLASDSLQGRMTGTPGQVQASLYCTRLFRQHHLAPIFQLDSSTRSFRQQYPFLISDITRYGPPKGFPSLPSTYKRYELLPPPATAKDSAKALYSHNVAALLVGTDLKQQVVVISAHYDHLGQEGNRIYHGADDNASGTASVLGIAALFDSLAQQGIRSRMSILFVLFSGEEGGLIGSQHFMLNCPIPLDQFVCDLNVDMVGRVDDDHRKKPNYCYLITDREGRGRALQQAAEIANNQSVGLSINQDGYDVESDPEQHFYRSDQINFARSGIPALFFTNGNHPDYHQLSDTADKIVYAVLQKRATLVFQTAWLIANPKPKTTAR